MSMYTDERRWSDDDEAPLELECKRCGREFETMNHLAAYCGPCRRKEQAAKEAERAINLSKVRGNQP